jgi:PAP2 superfamily/Vanadium chloroperoxidase N-terminal domain
MIPILNRRTFAALLAAFLVVPVIHAALPVTGSPVAAWNEQALDAIRATATPPPRASRALAILHAAIHDAHNGITRDYRQYLVTENRPNANTSTAAAIATAAHDVLVQLFPTRATQFADEQATQLAPVPIGPARTRGVAWGQTVAAALLAARANDGSSAVVTYIPGTGPGFWRPTPPAFAPALLPQWADVAPFGVRPIETFVPKAPPALHTAKYAAELAQVQSLGSVTSAIRTADQTEIARFWANGAGTATPPGHWNQIARVIVAQTGLTVGEEARLLALLNMAMADAAVVSWKAKYDYNYWRPVTAIREADTDGNPLTVADPGWTPLLVTPPFPEYTSGHSTFSGAAAAVLKGFFGTDDIAFTAESDDVPGVLRSYPSFSAASDESGMSRIYGGIHFMSGNRFGRTSGARVGNSIVKRLLRERNDNDDAEEQDEDDDNRLAEEEED